MRCGGSWNKEHPEVYRDKESKCEINNCGPIRFASATLFKAKQNYSQLEGEALGLIFAVKKLHKYIYGRKFILVIDNQPLKKILGAKSGIPPLAASRLQRWAILASMITIFN